MAKKKWEQDPNVQAQQVRQLSPGTQEVRNKPEETLRQIGISRAKGNVPLPPETQEERNIKEAEILRLSEEKKKPLNLQPTETPLSPFLPKTTETMDPTEKTPIQPSNVPLQPTEKPFDVSDMLFGGKDSIGGFKLEGDTQVAQNVVPIGLGVAGLGVGAGIASRMGSISSAVGKLLTSKKLVTLGVAGYLARGAASESGTILSASTAEMEKTISASENGLMSPVMAAMIFEEGMKNISLAESRAKRWSMINVFDFLNLRDTLLNFEIARRTTIPLMRQRLAEAQLKYQIAQARANYGNQPLR